MVDVQRHCLERQLRENVSRFLNETVVKHSPVAVFMERLKQRHWTCFLCGGTVRDLLLEKKGHISRDLDIIVHYVEKKELIKELERYDCRENRFGGFSVQVQDWKVDLWTLSSTWAFQNKLVRYSSRFSDYTKTPFLNIEAVAVELFAKKGKKRAIYSNGFFESIKNRMLEINLEANPDPEVNISRAIFMSFHYGFSLGPHLRNYITTRAHRLNKDRLLAIYREKYLLGDSNMDWLNTLFEEIERGECPSKLKSIYAQNCLF